MRNLTPVNSEGNLYPQSIFRDMNLYEDFSQNERLALSVTSLKYACFNIVTSLADRPVFI
jgi:hypothetical protein